MMSMKAFRSPGQKATMVIAGVDTEETKTCHTQRVKDVTATVDAVCGVERQNYRGEGPECRAGNQNKQQAGSGRHQENLPRLGALHYCLRKTTKFLKYKT